MYSNRSPPSSMALAMMAPVMTAGLNPPPEIEDVRPTATAPAVMQKPMAKPKKELPAWVLVVAVWITALISRKEKNNSAAKACPEVKPSPGLTSKVRWDIPQYVYFETTVRREREEKEKRKLSNSTIAPRKAPKN